MVGCAWRLVFRVKLYWMCTSLQHVPTGVITKMKNFQNNCACYSYCTTCVQHGNLH